MRMKKRLFFILTAKGIKSMPEYRELKEDVTNRDSAKRSRIHSELSIEEKTLGLINKTLKEWISKITV